MRPLRSPAASCRTAAASFIAIVGAAQFLVSIIANAANPPPPAPAQFQVDAVILTVLAQADGKILVPGESVRLNSDGTLDSTYKLAINGRVEAATLQSNGKCLIGHSDGVD